jgi:F0F1-type ATP synthase membrane subunit b/b'
MQINLTPDLSLLAIMVIFMLNYMVVSRFFLRPINEVLEVREAEIRSAQELYEQSLARFNEATAKMEEQLHGAKRQAATVRETFRAEAAAHRNAVLEKTTGEAKAMVGDADTRLGKDVVEARQKIVKDSESLARVAAERILGRPV